MNESLDILIIGAGFAGMLALHKARQDGWRARVLEAAPSVGGTWWANRYPGARVDIQSLEYSYAFDEQLQQDWHWSERYAAQPELLRYANHVADRFDLRRDIRLNTRLVQAHWDDAAGLWHTRDDAGVERTARFMVMATGPLSTPHTPRFEGLDAFRGRVLHTAQWPHEPVDVGGQRVGVIGTGSSGLQCIPPLARQAAQLTVFQRTPAYVVPAHNGPLDPAWEARVKADYPGFRARSRATRGGFGSDHPTPMLSALEVSPEEREARFEERWRIGGFMFLGAFVDVMLDLRANELAADFVRRKIRAAVKDPATAEALCPTHPIGCKRLCVDSDDYLGTFNRPNVRLVDLKAAPIERFTPTGLVGGGTEHAIDTLVLATGFDAMTGTLMKLDLRGRDGLRIQDKWAPGPLNLLGLMTAGFPNLFHVAGAGSPAAFTSVIMTIEHHVGWIMGCLRWLAGQGRQRIQADEAAEAAWMARLLEAAGHTVFVHCSSWYMGANVPGKPRVFMPLVGGFPAYAEHCAQVAQQGYPGFVTG